MSLAELYQTWHTYGAPVFNVALKIEDLGRDSGFAIDAADLNDDVRRARETADQAGGESPVSAEAVG